MSVDLSQFYQVFFEESFEGLDAMETALLSLDLDAVDNETINTIFRSAHSIKGGSATFGFGDVADFTHVLETLLDEVRTGSRCLEQTDVDLLLQSVDCLREMIKVLQRGEETSASIAQALKDEFQNRLDSDSSAVKSDTVDSAEKQTQQAQQRGWKIYFKPGQDILRTGNEPLRMFRELAELGELKVTADSSALPAFSNLDPEAIYLAWNLELLADVDKELVDEVFDWVVDESDLKILPLLDEPVSEPGINTEPVVQQPKQSEPVETIDANQTAAVAAQTAGNEENQLVERNEKVPAAAPRESAFKKSASNSDTSIRVSIDKVDQLINMVGELVITQSMLGQMGQDLDIELAQGFNEGLNQLAQNTRELQESVMQIRMLPISFAFSRFPRMVRDTSNKLGKKIELVMHGENTELDKTVMEKIVDPLVHLVRNSLDHGIEKPAERIAAGKPEHGTISMNAYHQGGNVVIEVSDNGGGLNKTKILEKALKNGLISSAEGISDEHVYDLIFQPGFSTADQVSDVSGRGVGMDVVRRNIQELNGTVEVQSRPGQGSVFTIRLPLTLAIVDGQLVRVGKETYIFPLVSIVESLQVDPALVNHVAGGCDVFRLRDEYVSIIRLSDAFNIPADFDSLEDALMVVVEHDNEKVGIVVDELLAQQQLVIKSLEENYRRIDGVSGATILGNGKVALILDIGGIVKMAGIQFSGKSIGISGSKSQSLQGEVRVA